MDGQGGVWPEAQAIRRWLNKMGIEVAHKYRDELRDAVTQERIQQMDRAESAEARARELEASCAALVERVTMLEEQLAKRNR